MRAFICAALVAAFLCALAPPVGALDHGFDHNSELVKWFEGLHRKSDRFPCCGMGDAYPIVIDQEASLGGSEVDGIAHVTDGSARKYPNGDTRQPIPNGTVIHFSGRQVTREIDGNPTSTAWAFIAVVNPKEGESIRRDQSRCQ